MSQVDVKTIFEVIVILFSLLQCTHSEDDDFLNKWVLRESEWLHEKATTGKRFHLVISFSHSIIKITGAQKRKKSLT